MKKNIKTIISTVVLVFTMHALNAQWSNLPSTTPGSWTPGTVGIGTSAPSSQLELKHDKDKTGVVITTTQAPSSTSSLPLPGSVGTPLPVGTNGGGLSSAIVISHAVKPLTGRMYSSSTFSSLGLTKPVFWSRHEAPVSLNSTTNISNSRFIILNDGKTGINSLMPRAMLDVNQTSFIYNEISAMFGVPAVGTASTNSVTGLNEYKTQHISLMPLLTAKRNNSIVQKDDLAIFFTDGKGTDGINQSSGLVIAPETSNPDVGGLRIDKDGNLEVRGEVTGLKFVAEPKWWSDFVFYDDYKLRSLSEVETFINNNGHLPDMESEEELKSKGLDLADMQAKQQQKIEELTLYAIGQDKKLKEQELRLQTLQEKIDLLLNK